jgi:hypothetical protein
MSAAYAMSLSPDKFDVTVFDKAGEAGGMATSVSIEAVVKEAFLMIVQIPIDASKYGAGYINDGVQGCSPQLSV